MATVGHAVVNVIGKIALGFLLLQGDLRPRCDDADGGGAIIQENLAVEDSSL